ncbi:methyl-accepting chemotaxis protein [Halobacteriovorax sp. HLS]|uniref:methyl-accepting chemotaxis protein n=1 Tax=Halobacteriovorax sp. HLS TaxID=2234000 RepID=UPI000FD8F176|nr:methyl-accepting chemotaxis protein [Halobacteriovorax sp. HLS]
MNLKKRLVLFFLLVGLVPFGAGVYFSVDSASDALTESVHDKLSASAALIYGQLEGLYESRYSSASVLSKSRKLQDIFVTADSSDWSSVEKYNSYFKSLLDETGFEDMLFVTNEGRILGALDHPEINGSNMSQFKDTPLYAAWKKAMSTPYNNTDSIQHAKYHPYKVWKNEQESFLVTRFAPNSKDRGRWLKDQSIGSIIFQMSAKRVDSILKDRIGMGETGETYLVEMKDDGSTIYASNRVVKKGPVGKAKKGSTITKLFKDKKNFNVTKKGSTGVTEIAYATYFKYKNSEYGIFTTQSKDEALASVISLEKTMAVVALISLIAIGFISTMIANQISGPILSISRELFSSADKVSDASKKVADTSSRLSSATTQQAAGLQETVSSIDEINAMIDRNTDASNESKKVSEHSRQVAEEGKQTIEQMIASINQISKSNSMITDQMSDNNQRVSEIVKLIKEIGDKTTVINDIVFQTKLLSFNASVEAARAGEHGKGFAVVAEEVGNLANMSGKAAEEISEMLENSVKTVEDIINTSSSKVEGLINTGKETVDKGSKLAEKCGLALDKIVENASKVNSQISEIATASLEQSQGVKEVNDAMKQIDEVTHMNTQISNETSLQATTLEDESLLLYKEVKRLESLVNGASNKKEANSSKDADVYEISNDSDFEQDKAA